MAHRKIDITNNRIKLNERLHHKSNNLHMQKQRRGPALLLKLISAFVFATWIIQFHFFLNPKFPSSSNLLSLYRLDCVGPGRKPHCWFSHEAAQIKTTGNQTKCILYDIQEMFAFLHKGHVTLKRIAPSYANFQD